MPVPIPPANAPTDKDLDTNILILGTILNDRDVQATAAYWEMSAKLPDGRSVDVELIAPTSNIVISHPDNSRPDTIGVQDYWPRKLDMRGIPPHDSSVGFVMGMIKGVKPTDFDKPNCSVTVCFQDSSGQRICDVVRQEDRPRKFHN